MEGVKIITIKKHKWSRTYLMCGGVRYATNNKPFPGLKCLYYTILKSGIPMDYALTKRRARVIAKALT